MYSGTCFLSLNIMLEIVSTFGVAVQKEGRKEGRKGGREGGREEGKEGRKGGSEGKSKQASNMSIHKRMDNDSMVYEILFRSKFK